MNSHSDTTGHEPPVGLKYERLREQLRQAILSGEWTGRLPGERVLAKRYEANAKTINKALSDLTIDGLLVRHVGRGTFVARDSGDGPSWEERKRTYGWFMPRDGVEQNTVYQQAADTIRALGHRLKKVELPDGATGAPADLAARPRWLRKMSGVVLFDIQPSDALLACLHRCHLPAVLANNRHETIRTPTVLADYVHGAFDLTQHLIHLGHTDVVLLIDPGLLPVAEDAEKGYRSAMHRYRLTARDVIRADPSGDNARVLDDRSRSTALVCIGDELAVRIFQQARQAGLSVPDNLSIAAIPEPGAPQAAAHQITTYEIQRDRIVDWATKLLVAASPGQVPQLVIVPGRLQARRSTSRPASSAVPSLPTPTETVM